MELGRGSESSGSSPECVPLRPRPRSPLDDYVVPESKQVLSELPLELLDSRTSFLIPKANPELFHPLVRTKANGPKTPLNLLGMRRLARAWQAANNDESRLRQPYSAPNASSTLPKGPPPTP